MLARVPASSANLGPGFDCLAVALTMYLEVSLELSDDFAISSEGCGAGLFDNEHNLGARIAAGVLGHSNFSMHVKSEIPLTRGLGSSAALAVAAATLLGGLVVATADVTDEVVARSLALDAEWRFVAVIPDEELSTVGARAVLPTRVPFADAVRNLSAMGLLLAGLADHDAFVDGAMDDYLHQPYRMGLLSFAQPLLATLRESGAAGSCWSGAGSSMLGLATSDKADGVASAAKSFLHDQGVAGIVHVLEADRTGLVTS